MNGIDPADIERIVSGNCIDPFSLLGPHIVDGKLIIRVVRPGVDSVDVLDSVTNNVLSQLLPIDVKSGFFEGEITDRDSPFTYSLRFRKHQDEWVVDDPYRFGPVIGDVDEYLISEGSHQKLWQVLGAHVMTHEGVEGTHFAVWAPNASRVSVVGEFNGWDGRCHCMRLRGQTGVWEIFMPGVSDGECYKFELLSGDGSLLPQKADPFGFGSEHPPRTASVVRDLCDYGWADDRWMKKRAVRQQTDRPISIYEVHLGSWARLPEQNNRMLSYKELAERLIRYVKSLGFTHIELMPISEFPFDGSWGYQPVGLFAPTIRHGTLNEFRAFVNACHEADLGLILDWVPGHFPEDQHGLGLFDGTPLYEHADKREGFHPDWNTLVYNFGRREVANYLTSNALYWLEEHHIDGLRVDAVASMLYRDYSRNDGEWIPNEHGGRENLEAISFLQRVNEISYGRQPGIITIAEESTAFPNVCGLTSDGGLGFGYKWNMGWMNDTLSYMAEDPLHRKHHHHKMTFGLHYAFSENFVLPISHDEVVHGKGSLIEKMPGSREEKIANLRAYFGFMWGHPGKKLLFMGNEFAQQSEWNHQQSLDWHLLDDPLHMGVQALIRDLNSLYCSIPSMHELDNVAQGFEWIEEQAADESVFAWLRRGLNASTTVLVVCNFTPVERCARRVGVPVAGRWREILNTDAVQYGGHSQDNSGLVMSEPVAASGRDNSLSLTLPPLSTLFFQLES